MNCGTLYWNQMTATCGALAGWPPGDYTYNIILRIPYHLNHDITEKQRRIIESRIVTAVSEKLKRLSLPTVLGIITLEPETIFTGIVHYHMRFIHGDEYNQMARWLDNKLKK